MAIHTDEISMMKEALQEYLEVARYCVEFDKAKDSRWKSSGCYGYPTALLLLSIADAIGTIVKNGGDDMKKHFTIFNDPNYYNFNLTDPELEALRKKYRHLLSHNAHIEEGVLMDIGNPGDSVIESSESSLKLNLVPLFLATEKSIAKFNELN